MTTLAGSSVAGFTDGVGSNAKFASPTGLALDPINGYIYVTDWANCQIRKIVIGNTLYIELYLG